jgi:hypothetical protein
MQLKAVFPLDAALHKIRLEPAAAFGIISAMTINQVLLEAIALKKCVVATYNRTLMTLAPHILYSKHDALYVDAVALSRNGAPPKEKKLGAFNLAGLSDVSLAEYHFEPERVFDPNEAKYAGVTLFAVAA